MTDLHAAHAATICLMVATWACGGFSVSLITKRTRLTIWLRAVRRRDKKLHLERVRLPTRKLCGRYPSGFG